MPVAATHDLPSSLEALRERTIEKALAHQTLRARGLDTLQSSLRTTAPNAPRAPMQPVPLATRVTAGAATGPLPGLTVAPLATMETLDDGAVAAVGAQAPTLDDAAAALGQLRADDGARAAPRVRALRGSNEALANRAASDADAPARMRAKRDAARARRDELAAAKRAKRAAGAADDGEMSESEEAGTGDEMLE